MGYDPMTANSFKSGNQVHEGAGVREIEIKIG